MKRIKIWLHNILFFIKHYIKLAWVNVKHYIASVWDQIKLKENTDARVGMFVFFYLFLSIIGAYNIAHLIAFGYIIWLLEKNLNKE